MVDLLGVGAHYAISSMFEAYADQNSIYSYNVDVLRHHEEMAGRARMAVGQIKITSRVTCENADVTFGALHFGDHNLTAGVREYQGEPAYAETQVEVADAFSRADVPAAVLALHKHFPGHMFSLKSLFRDEQRKVLDEIMGSVLADAAMAYGHLYELHAPLMRFLTDIHMPLPPILRMTSELTVNSDLRRLLSRPEIDLERVQTLLDAARREQVQFDAPRISYELKKRISRVADEFGTDPDNPETFNEIETLVRAVKMLPFEVDLWTVQNAYFDVLRRNSFDKRDPSWMRRFEDVGQQLGLALNLEQLRQPAAA
jgi:hypothetical protein